MCGIVGAFRTSHSSARLDSALLISMRDCMVHRGPDDAGMHVDEKNGIGLAFRRLAIIDLSPGASQPMSNEDGSVWVLFNGEIYNHADLRPHLEQAGCRFKTDHSDTEVILRGYEKWGEGVLPRLRGMFAFCIWDKKKDRLWIARDRMGVKPLYYALHNGVFLFASEIKAILKAPDFPRRMHERAFYDFLTFLASPAPQTLFDGVQKLPAGHTLTVHRDGRLEIRRYWNPFTGVRSIQERSEKDWTDAILASLRESVRYRMVSDVNFGVFLSGGIDSSANVALMAEQMNRPVETFSIGFEGSPAFNELNYARKVVDRYKTNHHEIIIGPEDLVNFLPKLVYHQDEPIVDPVCVPVYYVAKLAKDNGTTVCQVGEGADELFCGYPYWGMMLDFQPTLANYQRIPLPFRRMLGGLSNLPMPWRQLRGADILRRISNDEPIFWGGAEAYQETVKRRFLSSAFLDRMKGYTSVEPLRVLRRDFFADAPPEADELHWMSYLDLRFRLPELLLMRVDKMTMATAVEARVPFLDQEFIRLAMSIPQELKYKNRTLKYLLKKAVEPILPHDVIYRKKQGFGVPVEDWFQSKLRTWSDKKILDFASRTDYFDIPQLKRFLSAMGAKSSWFLLNFVLWHEQWIENRPPDLPS